MMDGGLHWPSFCEFFNDLYSMMRAREQGPHVRKWEMKVCRENLERRRGGQYAKRWLSILAQP